MHPGSRNGNLVSVSMVTALYLFNIASRRFSQNQTELHQVRSRSNLNFTSEYATLARDDKIRSDFLGPVRSKLDSGLLLKSFPLTRSFSIRMALFLLDQIERQN